MRVIFPTNFSVYVYVGCHFTHREWKEKVWCTRTPQCTAIDLPTLRQSAEIYLGMQCNEKPAERWKATARVRGWNPVMEFAHPRIPTFPFAWLQIPLMWQKKWISTVVCLLPQCPFSALYFLTAQSEPHCIELLYFETKSLCLWKGSSFIFGPFPFWEFSECAWNLLWVCSECIAWVALSCIDNVGV